MIEPDDDEPVVGLTGARFGGRRRRSRTVAPPSNDPGVVTELPAPAPESPADEPADEPAVGLTGARFGRPPARPQRRPAPEAAPEPAPVELRPAANPAPYAEEFAVDGDGVRVRPYVLTGGRTRASRSLPLEALVSVSSTAAAPGAVEHQQVAQQVIVLCGQPRSVAEIAALMRVPVGVVQVLVSDLADAGAVAVHAAAPTDLDLMRRVLAGLRRL